MFAGFGRARRARAELAQTFCHKFSADVFLCVLCASSARVREFLSCAPKNLTNARCARARCARARIGESLLHGDPMFSIIPHVVRAHPYESSKSCRVGPPWPVW